MFAGESPAVGARPPGDDVAAAGEHVVTIVGGGGEAGVIWQNPQAGADGETGEVDGRRARDLAVLLMHGGDGEAGQACAVERRDGAVADLVRGRQTLRAEYLWRGRGRRRR